MNPVFYNHDYLHTPNVGHGFFSRMGGVSLGIYAGLNCGPGSYDNAQHVMENRRRAIAALSQKPEGLCTVHQVHSPNVVIVHEPFSGPAPQADAMVTNMPGITLGILTADCAPVLFADAEADVIGAAHAGWKGAHGGVLENTIEAMEKLGAQRARIRAVIGPCISQKSYEVGPEFIARFEPEMQAQFFIRSNQPGHFMFDLPGYAAWRLHAAGLQRIAQLAMDTCADAMHFFSYRRATLMGEPDYGRQISAIALHA